MSLVTRRQLQEISLTHLRIVDGAQSELQLCALVSRMAMKAIKPDNFKHIPDHVLKSD